MVDLKAKYESGQTWQDWIAAADKNQEMMLEKFENYPLTHEDLHFLRALKHEVHVLAISEAWCGDVARQLPIVAKMSEHSNKVNLRIIDRDGHPEVIERYLNNGAKAIPVFIFFSEQFIETGNWKARPQKCNEIFARYKVEGDIDTGRKKCKEMMNETNDRMTVDEISKLLDISQGLNGELLS